MTFDALHGNESIPRVLADVAHLFDDTTDALQRVEAALRRVQMLADGKATSSTRLPRGSITT